VRIKVRARGGRKSNQQQEKDERPGLVGKARQDEVRKRCRGRTWGKAKAWQEVRGKVR
jgi:hypothetical protein